ncbi:MAG: aminotransferase class III-fold pyridoxal phosphate-dependent enzyme [Kordiimonadaceae bacterium]|nr:aminotransferase class III-fold pyridoxal phosphate-dependent enzyme [Kordiimonadaceae bacterium]MBO6568686.1 aminotransferase class III-fold pyridoxal phosphate-dependent enzyme [Kordiimonadaceae bacterium]MBO6965338.1 aminotransferase class III-fold pyridoxal phosphate-dependent enzyme [Kordiimonadaceae bacterium]
MTPDQGTLSKTLRNDLSPTTDAIQAQDNAHHLHPFTVHHELRDQNPRVISKAKGVYLWDSDGNRIIDGMAGLWCTQVGYGVEELADIASDAIKSLSYYNTFFQTTTPAVAALSELVASKTPADLNQIFFASSGSEANDTTIKFINYYWNLKGQPQKKAIIAREKAYHGTTIGAASLTGLPFMHDIFDLPLPGIHHIGPTPHYFEYGEDGESEEEFAGRCAQALEDKILELGAENVAAFIGEPVMGAGGLMTPPKGYWQKIEAICRKYDVLLWSDEVICGFGRTGSWFGCQTYGYTPDIITMAKGMSSGYVPISAVALNEEIASTIVEADSEMAHGFTYSGHPVCSSVALRNIQLLEEWDLVGERGKKTSEHFQKRLSELADHPLVGQTRGIGMLGALELVKEKGTKERFDPEGHAGATCRTHCFNTGVVMRAVGDTMFLSPPLVISEDEIDEMFDLIKTSLDLTHQSLNG